MSARRCKACGGRARAMQRATILSGPGKMEPGYVCSSCARHGWLLVLGADAPDTPSSTARKAKKARAVGALMQHVLGATLALLVAFGCSGSGSSIDAGDAAELREDGGSVGLVDAYVGSRDASDVEHDAAQLDAGDDAGALEPECEGDARRFCGAADCQRVCILGSNRVCCEAEPEGVQECTCTL